jgi:hypothetical protein
MLISDNNFQFEKRKETTNVSVRKRQRENKTKIENAVLLMLGPTMACDSWTSRLEICPSQSVYISIIKVVMS